MERIAKISFWNFSYIFIANNFLPDDAVNNGPPCINQPINLRTNWKRGVGDSVTLKLSHLNLYFGSPSELIESFPIACYKSINCNTSAPKDPPPPSRQKSFKRIRPKHGVRVIQFSVTNSRDTQEERLGARPLPRTSETSDSNIPFYSTINLLVLTSWATLRITSRISKLFVELITTQTSWFPPFIPKRGLLPFQCLCTTWPVTATPRIYVGNVLKLRKREI